MPNKTQEVQKEKLKTSESPLLGTFSEIISSFLKIAQQNIIGRIQETVNDVLDQAKTTANQIMRDVVMLFAIVLLGLIGFIFTITGLSLWLGAVSGFGTWFGFFVVGITVFIVALIVGLIQKNKRL